MRRKWPDLKLTYNPLFSELKTMIQFEERAVAFIDVLGFKSLVEQAALSSETLKQLSKLVELLEGVVPRLDATVDSSVPPHLIPKHNCISDCIILSAPIRDEDRIYYNGLEIVIMRVIQLTHFFLDAGYLIRGGISVGKVWHTDTNIVGPAYQEAYLLEAKGDEPMVVLSDSAKQICRWGSRMCLQQNDKVFVNGLHDYYIPGNTVHGAIETAYSKYEKLTDNVLNSQVDEKIKNKWSWFKDYLDSESKNGMKWAEPND
jgi:hypothetical protein